MSRRKQSLATEPGTKSVSFTVVPSADPKAPFGCDENDKALVPMRPDQAIATRLLERPDLAPGKCHHKKDPSNCLECGTKRIRPRQTGANQSPSRQSELRRVGVGDVLTPEEAEAQHREVLEESARRVFKTPKPMPSACNAQASAAFDSLFDKKKPPAAPAPKKPSSLNFDCYRELLMIERDTIVDLFDFIVEHIRPEKPTEGLIERLQKEIADLEALILTRSSAWQKRHRMDDRLEKNDRERLKHQEKKECAKKKIELSEARACLRKWENTPPVSVTFGEKYWIPHRSFSTDTKFKPDIKRTPKGWDPYDTEVLTDVHTFESGEYNIHEYKNMLKLGIAEAWRNDDLPISGWVEWENKVILQAIKCGLIKPNVDVLKNYPGLDIYVRPDDPIETDHTAEKALIIKTGAAEIGGSVRGAGYTGVSNNTKRALQDFTGGPKNKGGNAHPSGDGFIPDFGDDSESYQPNEG
jgi:hypothetical protein